MSVPYITIDIAKIEHNTKVVVEKCKESGIDVAGITKVVLALPEVANAMIRGGVKWIGETRLKNIERLRANGISIPFLLIRSPHISEIERVIDLVDISINTEYEVLKSISDFCLRKKITHKVIVMVDAGDLREGVWPDEVIPLFDKIINLKGLNIVGLAINLIDLNGIVPTLSNNMMLIHIAEEIESRYNINLEYLSAGNSSSISLLGTEEIPSRVNHFRIGEGILLGRETINRNVIANTFQDAFILYSEVIESKTKPSVPIGIVQQNAFGEIKNFTDKGIMKRSIVGLGRQDVDSEGIFPRNKQIEILGATSDHLVLDTTNDPSISVGSIISFDLNYSALLAAMTSPFVEKKYI